MDFPLTEKFVGSLQPLQARSFRACSIPADSSNCCGSSALYEISQMVLKGKILMTASCGKMPQPPKWRSSQSEWGWRGERNRNRNPAPDASASLSHLNHRMLISDPSRQAPGAGKSTQMVCGPGPHSCCARRVTSCSSSGDPGIWFPSVTVHTLT